MLTFDYQTMAKYVSRFALGLSNSVPGIVVNQPNIRFIDDISTFLSVIIADKTE